MDCLLLDNQTDLFAIRHLDAKHVRVAAQAPVKRKGGGLVLYLSLCLSLSLNLSLILQLGT